MAGNANIYFDSKLPWTSSREENATFFKITLVVLLFTTVFAVYVGLNDLPEVPRAEREKLPPQLAQIIQAKKPPPPPVPIEPEPQPEPELQEKPPIEEPVKPKEQVAEITPPVTKKPVETVPNDEEKVAQARETAKSSGLLQFADQLASMRQQPNLTNKANTTLTQGGGEAQSTQRKVIAGPALNSSGGIQTAGLSSNVGAAGELEGRRSTEFSAATTGEAAIATQRVEKQQQVIGNRNLDEIRQVLDANKGAVYSLYRRALRQDPNIQGKLTVKLVIEPNGSLQSVTLVEDELNSPDLVAKLITRIQMINFGSANALRTELEYSYNFLPF